MTSQNGTVRARHGTALPVAGLPDAGGLLGVLDRDLDGPAGRVPFDDLAHGGTQVGVDQRHVLAGGRAVADQHDLDLLPAEAAVPKAGDDGGLDLHGGP